MATAPAPRATKKAPSAPTKAAPLGKYDLQRFQGKIPEHQLRLMTTVKNYHPDPETGLSRWPIPGMQGSRSPWVAAPYAEENREDDTVVKDARWTTSNQRAALQALGLREGPPEEQRSGVSWTVKYKQNWQGRFTIPDLEHVQRSYEESGGTCALLPGGLACKGWEGGTKKPPPQAWE
jgi:hypothetical protein